MNNIMYENDETMEYSEMSLSEYIDELDIPEDVLEDNVFGL